MDLNCIPDGRVMAFVIYIVLSGYWRELNVVLLMVLLSKIGAYARPMSYRLYVRSLYEVHSILKF